MNKSIKEIDNKNQVLREFHLVDISKSLIFMIYKYKGPISNSNPIPITMKKNGVIKYLGKIVLYKDGKIRLNFIDKEIQKKFQSVVESIEKDGIYGYTRSKNIKFGDVEYVEALEYWFNSLKYRTISKDVGEKYLKNGWQEARGTELIDAIECLDKYPINFRD